MRQSALELEQSARDLILHGRAAALVVDRRSGMGVSDGGSASALGAVGSSRAEDAATGGRCRGDNGAGVSAAAGGERHVGGLVFVCLRCLFG